MRTKGLACRDWGREPEGSIDLLGSIRRTQVTVRDAPDVTAMYEFFAPPGSALDYACAKGLGRSLQSGLTKLFAKPLWAFDGLSNSGMVRMEESGGGR